MRAVRRRLQIFFALFLVVTASGTFGFMTLENLSFSEALYYNIVTMSTVGYGDIHPTKQVSRLFAIFLIVMGPATFLGVIANITEMILLKRETQGRIRKVNMILGVFLARWVADYCVYWGTSFYGGAFVKPLFLLSPTATNSDYSNCTKLDRSGRELRTQS